MFAHEFGHTYQSRITGPLYLFKYGVASVYDNDGLTEGDATRRGASNTGIEIKNRYPTGTSTYKWREALSGNLSWPVMWMWNY